MLIWSDYKPNKQISEEMIHREFIFAGRQDKNGGSGVFNADSSALRIWISCCSLVLERSSRKEDQLEVR